MTRASCQQCASPHHEDCFITSGRCGIPGCSGTMAPIVRSAVDRGPQRFVMDFVSGREFVTTLILAALVIVVAPVLIRQVAPAQTILYGSIMPSAVMLTVVAVWVRTTLFDDHWIVDPPLRQILSHRRFLGFTRITPVVAFDDVAALVIERHVTAHGRKFERVHLELKNGRREDLTTTSFSDVPAIPQDDTARPQHAALAALIGVPLRVESRES